MAVLLVLVLYCLTGVVQAQALSQSFGGHDSALNATRPDLRSHIEAAAWLVKQWRIPEYKPLAPTIYIGLDPALATAGPAYQRAAHASCDKLLGMDFLHKWHSNKQQYCESGIDPLATGDVDSEIDCFLAPDINPGMPLSVCVARNMVLANSTAFMGPVDVGQVMPKPETTICTPAYWGKFPRPLPGSVKVACQAAAIKKTAIVVPDVSSHGPGGYAMVDHVASWMVTALQDRQYDAVANACGSNGSYIVEHPVLFVSDTGHPNVYHAVEAFTIALAFIAAHAPEMARDGFQVVLVDNESKPGPFIIQKLWQHISSAAPVRFLRTEPFPPNTCFRKAVVLPIPFYTSILKIGSHRQLLCRSALAVGMASWLREVARETTIAQHPPSTFAALGDTYYQPDTEAQWAMSRMASCSKADTAPRTYQIIFMGRHLHKKPRPNIDFKDTEFYLNWQLFRELFNEQELLDAIKTTVFAWNGGHMRVPGTCGFIQATLGNSQVNCRPRVTFSVEVLLGNEPLQHQLNTVMSSTIMVGVHGAGLTYAFFMPPGGALLELIPGHYGGGANHYHSIANMVGHGYERSIYVPAERRANVLDVTIKLLKLMRKLGACSRA